MAVLSSRTRIARVIFVGGLAALAGMSATIVRTSLMNAQGPKQGAATAAPAEAPVTNAVPPDPAVPSVAASHLFHVRYKSGTVDYIWGDTLVLQEGNYLLISNHQGMPETVAAFPSSALESVVAVSNERN